MRFGLTLQQKEILDKVLAPANWSNTISSGIPGAFQETWHSISFGLDMSLKTNQDFLENLQKLLLYVSPYDSMGRSTQGNEVTLSLTRPDSSSVLEQELSSLKSLLKITPNGNGYIVNVVQPTSGFCRSTLFNPGESEEVRLRSNSISPGN